MTNPAVDLDALAQLGAGLERDYAPDLAEWAACKIGWAKSLEIAVRGAVGFRLARLWLESQGLHVGKAGETRADCRVEDIPVEVKFATRSRRGTFTFNQVRDEEGYSYVLLLGVTPTQAFCWIVPRAEALSHARPQHRGQRGDGKTRILLFAAGAVPAWLQPYGGPLENVDPRPLLGL